MTARRVMKGDTRSLDPKRLWAIKGDTRSLLNGSNEGQVGVKLPKPWTRGSKPEA